jgi:Holliday junction resolvase RusA-like endonuclease
LTNIAINNPELEIFIAGKPAAKQSMKFTESGHVYQRQNVKDWQELIGWKIKEKWHEDPLEGFLVADLTFYLKTNFADADNLSKAVLDAMNLIVYKDDKQIMELHSVKIITNKMKGVFITIGKVGS